MVKYSSKIERKIDKFSSKVDESEPVKIEVEEELEEGEEKEKNEED